MRLHHRRACAREVNLRDVRGRARVDLGRARGRAMSTSGGGIDLLPYRHGIDPDSAVAAPSGCRTGLEDGD